MEESKEVANQFWEQIKAFFNMELVKIGQKPFTLLTALYMVVAFVILLLIAKKLSKFLENKVLSSRISDRGVRSSISAIFKYIFIFLGIIFIFQSAGFDFGSFSYLAGALGVGIGFGLQNIAQNFISGLVILFERPIKVGDRIEVGNIVGDVTSISMRSTKIVTNDNINVIVPNSEFINNKVINWSYNERKVRFRFPIGVSYNENPSKVREITLEVAQKHKGVLNFPEPQLLFDDYGDSSLNFELVEWTSTYIQRPKLLKSELYYAIFEAFSKEGIEIPFPQRDLNLRNGFEHINDFLIKKTPSDEEI
ncbi:mechanosensitive ion channel family protein [Ornithobacterium rhinotracheale]|uniref:mechanosensitive ion channel family protein n=1 Tax=Ornithobacterium rhinotracheale TaxID=28251 RepID=UPI0040375246